MTKEKKQQIPANQQRKPQYKWKMLKWWLIAQIIPACFACFVSFYLLQRTSLRFEFAIPLSVAWGAMGATIHYLSIKRGMRFRLIWTVVFAFFTVGAGFGLVKIFSYDYSKLQTCPVCGFVTLPEPAATCPLCRVRFDKVDADTEGYASLDEYLQAEQLMFFQPEGTDTTVNFYAPCNCPEKFPKSADWKPSVTAQDVREVRALTQQPKP
jgi:hypothetical protein